MLTTLALSMMLTTPDGAAVFEGGYIDSRGTRHSYAVTALVDGTIRDTDGRSGVYSIVLDSAGNRDLILDFGLHDIYILQGGPGSCFAEAQPPVNPDLGELAVCLAPQQHQLAHFDTQMCDDLDRDPIYITSSIYPQESGHWMAGRLTSDSPFWVYQVKYPLNTVYTLAPYDCAPVDHKVQLFMGPADSPPPATPTVLREFDVAGASLLDPWSEVTLLLSEPLYLPPGQSLFVSVEMVSEESQALCIALCGSPSTLPEHTYWSDAAAPPYPWYDLIPGFHDMMVQAKGVVVP